MPSSFDGCSSGRGGGVVSALRKLALFDIRHPLVRLAGPLHLVTHIYQGSFPVLKCVMRTATAGEMAGDITISQFGIYQNGI